MSIYFEFDLILNQTRQKLENLELNRYIILKSKMKWKPITKMINLGSNHENHNYFVSVYLYTLN